MAARDLTAGRGALLGAVVCAAALLAACGASSPHRSTVAAAPTGARHLLAEARAAAYGARSVRLRGSISTGGGPIFVDVGIVADMGGAGRVTAHGQTLDLVVDRGHAYVRGDAAAYAAFAPRAAVARLAGRWVALPPGSPADASLRSLTSLESLLGDALAARDGVYEAGRATIDGQSAVELRDPQGGALYVSSSATPWPLALAAPAARGKAIEMRDWNAPLRLRVPRGAVAVTQLAPPSRP